MRLIFIAVFMAYGCSPINDHSERSIHVFAASSLTDALHELISRFEHHHPDITVHLHLGPTSLLARQIVHGAPADLFLAASPVWIDYLHDHGLIQDRGVPFAGNTLVIVGTPDTPQIPHLSSLPTMEHLAMADPSHVPAGVYGKQALQCAGLWDSLESKVIPTLDARAAMTAVTSRSVDAALVYGSDLGLTSNLKFMFQIPAECTPDITYVIAVMKATQHPKITESFVAFTTDSLQQGLWTQFGLSP